MKAAFVFHPDVEGDVDEGYNWYERRRPGLGEDFLAAVEEVYAGLRMNPQAHPRVYRKVRRASARRFPYGIFYRLHADRIEILAVQHSRQDAGRWQSRVS